MRRAKCRLRSFKAIDDGSRSQPSSRSRRHYGLKARRYLKHRNFVSLGGVESMAQFTTPPDPRYSKVTVQTLRFEVALRLGIGAYLAGSAQVDAQELLSAPMPAYPASVSATQADSAALPPICTDRPSKSNYACTVDAGHFQYESDLVNESSLRQGDEATTTWLILNPTLKYGLTDKVDIEANMTALEILRTQNTPATRATLMGVSDLYLRVKYEFINLPKVVQAAIIPYLEAPTGRAGIGDGKVSGGFLLPNQL
jgi:hypothetical protein